MGGPEVRLREMGSLEFSVGGERVPVRGRRAAMVLARLSIAAPAGCSAVDLVDAIWGVDSPPTALQSLINTIADIRRRFGAGVIETTGDGYRLGDEVESDRREFLRRSALVERKHRVAASDALVEIEAAKNLWRGEPYSGSLDDDWVVGADRDRLVRGYEEMRRVEVAVLASLGRHDDAIALASEVVTSQPLDEDVWVTLVDSLRATGQPMRALQTVRRALTSLREEGLTPSASLRRVESELTHMPSDGVAPARTMERSGWRMLAGCVDHWASGRTDAAIAELEQFADIIPADDRRRFARAFAGSDPGNGWARGLWTEVVGLANRMPGIAERLLISLDANALERDPDGLSTADAEVVAADDQETLIRALRVRFMAGCAHPLDAAQKATVERLAAIPDDEATIEAERFESIIAAKEGRWQTCLEALDRYEQLASELRPNWHDDFASLSRAVLQMSGVAAGQQVDDSRSLYPLLGNVNTFDVVQIWRQLDGHRPPLGDVEALLSGVVATLPADTADALTLLVAEAVAGNSDAQLGRAIDVVDVDRRHRYWQLGPVAIGKAAIRRRDRDLAWQMSSALEPWSGEQLGLWPLDLIIGPADELLDQLSAV